MVVRFIGEAGRTGEAFEPGPQAGLLSRRLEVGPDVEVVPPRPLVVVPGDVVDRDSGLGSDAAAGEVADVVSRSERFHGEAPGLSWCRPVHAQQHSELVGEAVRRFEKNDGSSGVEEGSGVRRDVLDGVAVAAAVVGVILQPAIRSDHERSARVALASPRIAVWRLAASVVWRDADGVEDGLAE